MGVSKHPQLFSPISVPNQTLQISEFPKSLKPKSSHSMSSTHFLHNDETEQIQLLPSEEEEEEEDDDDDDDYDYDEEEEETEDDDDDEEEEEEEEGDGGVYVGGHPETTSRQVLRNNHVSDINSQMAQQVVSVDDLPAENANEVAPVAECDRSAQRIDIRDNGEEKVDGQIDGLFCPICSEAWSSGGGHHHVCCLPCGHMYGFSCIEKWLRRPGSRKCPQCRKKCGLKGIRLLYASRVVAIDGELQKTVESLEEECASLRRKNADLTKREADLSKQLQLAIKVDAESERAMREKLKSMNEMMKPMYEMVKQMYEWHIGQGHVEPLPPR